MQEPIFVKAVLQEKIWGGDKLQTEFGMELPSDKIGEAWAISAHPNGISTVVQPQALAGMPLDQLYEKQPELFGMPHPKTFPLLIKLLDASEELSVQVHPDDTYGLEHEGELGKTECWYIISAEPGAEIIYGHQAQTREEFEEMVAAGEWDDLLTKVPVKAGDFFYVPHGTIHAIGAGIVILETQQNSDTTYRVYDYNRMDDYGNTRDLHIKQSADVTMFPHQDPELDYDELIQGESKATHFLTNEFFSVYKWQVLGQLVLDLPKQYYLVTVIKGQGQLEIAGQTYDVKLADSFIIPTEVKTIKFFGDLELIASNPE